jgi:hypothetical protein
MIEDKALLLLHQEMIKEEMIKEETIEEETKVALDQEGEIE